MNAYRSIAALRVRALPADQGAAAEAFLAAQGDAQPFHSPRWVAAIERACGQRAHLLVAEDADGIAGLLPLSELRSLLFGSALVSVGFGVGGGIVARRPDAAAALAEAAWRKARSLGLGTVELRGGTLPEGWTVEAGTYAGFARALPDGEKEILKSIPRKERAEIRRASANRLDVRVGRSARDLDDHYRVYAESVRNLGTPVFPRRLFAEMLTAFGDHADILTVSDGSRALASVLSFYWNDTVYPYWGGGVFEARATRANELMHFALMRHAAERGCTRFDFGRSKVGTGAYHYKRHWGFEPEPLAYAVRSEGPPRDVNPQSGRYRLQVAAWKKLPLWLANRLGPPIARGLG